MNLGHFGFSYIGLIYMLFLEVPNILWARHKPEGYDPSGESKVLLVFERIGQVLCTATVLFFSDTNPRGVEPWLLWLIASALLMVVYEYYWLRYFRGGLYLEGFLPSLPWRPCARSHVARCGVLATRHIRAVGMAHCRRSDFRRWTYRYTSSAHTKSKPPISGFAKAEIISLGTVE